MQNSHRAIDDVLATVAVLQAMWEERDDLLRYINLFGYNARYGLEANPFPRWYTAPRVMSRDGRCMNG